MRLQSRSSHLGQFVFVRFIYSARCSRGNSFAPRLLRRNPFQSSTNPVSDRDFSPTGDTFRVMTAARRTEFITGTASNRPFEILPLEFISTSLCPQLRLKYTSDLIDGRGSALLHFTRFAFLSSNNAFHTFSPSHRSKTQSTISRGIKIRNTPFFFFLFFFAKFRTFDISKIISRSWPTRHARHESRAATFPDFIFRISGRRN